LSVKYYGKFRLYLVRHYGHIYPKKSMSSFANADITGPTCRNAFPITYWKSVNVTIDPPLRERVLSGDIHRHTCPRCGQINVMRTPLLYHDTTCGFMVNFEMERPEKPITWNTKFLDDSARLLPQYQYRFVTSWEDLTEKITIFENGWDDTIIEVLKLVVTENVYPFGSPEFTNCTVILQGTPRDTRRTCFGFRTISGGPGELRP
jgi:hypothetical protein